jgi:serine phosphatase RsbU (regulator of sigma subunit)
MRILIISQDWLNLLLIILAFIGLTARGASARPNVVVLKSNVNEYPLGRMVDLYTDETGKLSLEDIKSKSFQPSTQDVINLGFNTQTHWVRIIVDNHANHPEKEWILDLAYPILSYVTFYAPDTFYKLGGALPYHPRPIDHRDFAFPVRFHTNKTDTFYLQIKSSAPNIYPLTLETRDQWRQNNSVEDVLLAIFYGAIFIMVIYNSLLFISVKDLNYLPYIGYVIAFGFFFAALRGLSKQYWAQDSLWLNLVTINGSSAVAGYCLCWFSRIFLNLRQIAPKTDKLFKIFQYIWAAYLGLVLINLEAFLPEAQLVYGVILNIIAFITPLFAISAGLIAWKNGYKPARIYVVAFSILLIGMSIQVLKNLTVFDHNLWTEYAFQYGILIEQALLAVALGDKINVVRAEIEQAQAIAIDALIENERIIKEQKEVLESKIEERTKELNDKNRLLTDSINYSKNIQVAMLPTPFQFEKALSEHFILFKPKDIVSGDFYWIHQRRHRVIVLCADCTGHGVAGAFMSLIGINIFSQIIREHGVELTPDLVLNEANQRLLALFKQGYGETPKTLEGMDVGYCLIDFKNYTIRYAGAGRSMYYFSCGELHSIKGDKLPIGGASLYYPEVAFTEHSVQLNRGDTVYLFTDGITDQFNFEDRKKFNIKRLEQILNEVQHLSMREQRIAIEQALFAWQGNAPQTDDMCMIGFRMV